jgi:hypothetical protein
VKKIISIVIALTVGLLVLAGYFFRESLGPVLNLMLEWGVLLLGITGLIGIGYLLRMHVLRSVKREKGTFFSLVVIIAFFSTLIAGLLLPPQNAFYRDLVLNIQIPVETSLLAVLTVILLAAGLRLIRTRGWTLMSAAFLFGAVMSLVLNLGYFQFRSDGFASGLVAVLQRLPLAGARGILLGMALGGLIVGLRVLLTLDRPYGE